MKRILTSHNSKSVKDSSTKGEKKGKAEKDKKGGEDKGKGQDKPCHQMKTSTTRESKMILMNSMMHLMNITREELHGVNESKP